MLGRPRLAAIAGTSGSLGSWSENISGRIVTPVIPVITGVTVSSALTPTTGNLAGYGQRDGEYRDGADQQCE